MAMDAEALLKRALGFEFLAAEEGRFLYETVPTAELTFVANELRKIQKPDGKVTWQIDRNANTTNVCLANCKFCNFFVPPTQDHLDNAYEADRRDGTAYITSVGEYKKKIDELYRYGGDQLLLQGGHHPKLGLKFYADLFRELKKLYPELRLNALGPPEIAHICKLEGKTHREALSVLRDAGLDSLPGAGAEILSDRVRRMISRGKCSGGEWLDVMRAAHQLNINTTATMMFGHIETLAERFEHLVMLRQVQSEKPDDAKGFLAFIPWPFQDQGTMLKNIRGVSNAVTEEGYIRMMALCRIMLPNVVNFQASWLTVGARAAQLCLHGGANDMGSIMIEENVVSAAGAPHRFTAEKIQQVIREAGFDPQLRSQDYTYREIPEMMEQQVIDY